MAETSQNIRDDTKDARLSAKEQDHLRTLLYDCRHSDKLEDEALLAKVLAQSERFDRITTEYQNLRNKSNKMYEEKTEDRNKITTLKAANQNLKNEKELNDKKVAELESKLMIMKTKNELLTQNMGTMREDYSKQKQERAPPSNVIHGGTNITFNQGVSPKDYKEELDRALADLALARRDIKTKDKVIEAKDKVIETKDKDIENKDKDIEAKDKVIEGLRKKVDHLQNKVSELTTGNSDLSAQTTSLVDPPPAVAETVVPGHSSLTH